ncbi:hypothetical protein J2W91_003513 [Paenibacillus amylolyticus]|uniref:Uncharacterized protein n=1 Tax=Paenibacillus amylolyticus TaxID=1451 RepID=A0AAP5H3B4_PAEAM|nr:hypothetical protein [Paenibacillus amylolyticus]
MHSNETLFEMIMCLNHTEILYRSPSSKRRITKANQIKPKKQRKPNPITLDSRYKHLVAEGSRLDIGIERRMEIRKELTLIRKQKRMMMKIEYSM